MRSAHLADLHLGFRAFAAMVGGRNLREVDVELAWQAAVTQILEEHEQEPIDLVTIAGDVFHHPRVSDHAKKAFLDGVRRLAREEIEVVVLQGNHDAGKTADVLTPIMLAEGWGEGVHVVTEPKRIRCAVLNHGHVATASVACFPFVSRGDGTTYALEPDPAADVNVLLMHASVKGAAEGDTLPYFYGSGDEALDVGREADRWDVIAVGDYHEFTLLHPNARAFYSGSIERTSSNIWNEHAPKGWVLVDTDRQTTEFREVPTRAMHDIDLCEFTEEGSVVERLNTVLTHLSVDGAVGPSMSGAILRLKVPDFPREQRDQIDWSLVREIKHRCAHFELDLRFAKKAVAEFGDRQEVHRRASVRDHATAFFGDDDPAVRDLIASYLDVPLEVVEEFEIVEEEEGAGLRDYQQAAVDYVRSGAPVEAGKV